MPYIKKTDPYEQTKKLLKAYGIGTGTMAKILKKSLPTARDRLQNPGHLTVGEWKLINKRGHVPLEDIKEVMFQ